MISPTLAARYVPDLNGRTPFAVALALAADYRIASFTGFGMKVNSIRADLPSVLCRCSENGVCRERAPGLHPRTRGWRQGATDDVNVIKAWAHHRQGCNMLAATGEASDLLILRVNGEAGGVTLASAEQTLGPLPETAGTVFGNVRDRWFRLPADAPVPWSSSAVMGADLGAGVEVLAEGGFAPIPLSVVGAGDVVAWAPSPKARPFAVLPPAWLERLAPEGGAPRRLPVSSRPNARIFARPA